MHSGSCSNYTKQIHYLSMYIIIHSVFPVPANWGSSTVYPTFFAQVCMWGCLTEQKRNAVIGYLDVFQHVLTSADSRGNCRPYPSDFVLCHQATLMSFCRAELIFLEQKRATTSMTSQSQKEMLWKLWKSIETVYLNISRHKQSSLKNKTTFDSVSSRSFIH